MDIVIAVGILGGLGLIFGLVLAAASKVFHVETDPRLESSRNVCPAPTAAAAAMPAVPDMPRRF